MKITALETIALDDQPNLTFVQVHTDEGLIGLGDAFHRRPMVVTYVHEIAAPLLLGEDPRAIERHWYALHRLSNGAATVQNEPRGISAIDVALWDISAQAAGLPLYRFMGGPTRESLRVYNTCAGARYGQPKPRGETSNYVDRQPGGRYEDLEAQLNRPEELAADLLEEGYSAMKIWPFDRFGPASNGERIGPEDLAKGVEPFERIRAAVGNRIDIALEMHSVWGLVAAQRIARAVEPFDPMWFEDPVRMDNMDTLRQFREYTRIPTTASETMFSRYAFREAFEKQALSIAMLDIGWVGGLSEARKVASMAEAYHLPIAPHDCVGPVTLAASIHLDYAVPNVYIQEVVRAYLHDVYPTLVTDVPRVERGSIRPFESPGIGTRLLPDIKTRAGATVRVSRLS
ncbi:MAG: mandelate racemase/muconate lactonizing enzyme family protein [Chloroflexota bacterium]